MFESILKELSVERVRLTEQINSVNAAILALSTSKSEFSDSSNLTLSKYVAGAASRRLAAAAHKDKRKGKRPVITFEKRAAMILGHYGKEAEERFRAKWENGATYGKAAPRVKRAHNRKEPLSQRLGSIGKTLLPPTQQIVTNAVPEASL